MDKLFDFKLLNTVWWLFIGNGCAAMLWIWAADPTYFIVRAHFMFSFIGLIIGLWLDYGNLKIANEKEDEIAEKLANEAIAKELKHRLRHQEVKEDGSLAYTITTDQLVKQAALAERKKKSRQQLEIEAYYDRPMY